MSKDSWLLRTASAFAALERSIKAAPLQGGALYPSSPSSSFTGYLTFPGWDRLDQLDPARRDQQRVKTATTSPWAFADVSAIAREFSTSELIVKERRGTKLEDVENHELERIWESPNEHMGRSFVSEFWATSYVFVGKAYLYWVPDQTGTSLMEVWPVPPWMIRPIPDAQDFIKGYAFKSSQDSPPILIPPELITYSHSINLFDVRDGLSFLAAAMTEIKADLAASVWNLNFFDDNNGVPDGFLGLSPDTLDQDVERVRMEIRDFFGGSKRGIAVGRSGDLKYQEFGRSQKDMEFSQGREFASKIIGRTLGFPDGYWSDLANRANAEQARRTMISGAVWPLLVRLSEDMNAARRGVVQRWYGEDTRVEFKDIRPEDKEAQAKELKMYEPFVPINRLLGMIGEEALDDTDPRGTMLVAEIAKGAPIPGTPAALLIEKQQQQKDEAAAQAAAAQIEAGQAAAPGEEAAPEAGAPMEGAPEAAPPAPEEDAVKAYPIKFIGKNGAAVDAWEPAVDLHALHMRQWEAKALRDFERKGRVYRAFESDVIDATEHTRIAALLADADSPAAIKAAFKRDSVDALLDDVDADARAWVEEATK